MTPASYLMWLGRHHYSSDDVLWRGVMAVGPLAVAVDFWESMGRLERLELSPVCACGVHRRSAPKRPHCTFCGQLEPSLSLFSWPLLAGHERQNAFVPWLEDCFRKLEVKPWDAALLATEAHALLSATEAPERFAFPSIDLTEEAETRRRQWAKDFYENKYAHG